MTNLEEFNYIGGKYTTKLQFQFLENIAFCNENINKTLFLPQSVSDLSQPMLKLGRRSLAFSKKSIHTH